MVKIVNCELSVKKETFSDLVRIWSQFSTIKFFCVFVCCMFLLKLLLKHVKNMFLHT